MPVPVSAVPTPARAVNVFAGQLLTERSDQEFFRQQARQFDFHEAS
jgi:hypothetical protein